MPPRARTVVTVVCCFAVLFLFMAGMAYGAEEGAPPEGGHGKSWFDLFKTTGIVGILLLLCSMTGTALLIQYMMTINASKLQNPELIQEVETLLGEGNLDEAYSLAEQDTSYTGKVLAGALNRSVAGFEEAKHGLEEASAVESFRLNAKLSYLSLIGNIGPLLGLLGTVTGMITSFQKIETMKAPTPADLAVGVYESLVNTTIGLFIAITFLSAYFFMKNKASDIMLRINTEISELLSRTMAPAATE